MSREGHCFEDALVESSFASHKREERDGATYLTRNIGWPQDVFACLEQLCNHKWRHAYLGHFGLAEAEVQHPASLKRIA